MRGRSRMVRSARREGRGGAGRGEARTVADALGAEREGGDDGPDRLGETRAGAADEVARQPTRPRLGVRRDDDLVGGEHGERVLDGLQRIAVPDLARDTDSRRAQPRERRIETLPGRAGGAARRRSRAARRAPSASDVRLRRLEPSAGATTMTSPPTFFARNRIAWCRTVPVSVSLEMTRTRSPVRVPVLRSSPMACVLLDRGVEVAGRQETQAR